jgi:hypothetical protein
MRVYNFGLINIDLVYAAQEIVQVGKTVASSGLYRSPSRYRHKRRHELEKCKI